MDDIEGLTFPMEEDVYEGIGGALSDAYQVREVSKVDPKSTDVQTMPIILVSKAPQTGGETLTDLSGFTAKTGLSIDNIVALNGIAVLKQLAAVAPANDIQKYLYLNPETYTNINKLISIQVHFIVMFQHVYFLAQILQKNLPKLPVNFSKKFTTLQTAMKQDPAIQGKVFGVPYSSILPFVNILQTTKPISGSPISEQILKDHIALLQKSPKELNLIFQGSLYRENINADEVRSATTNENFMALSVYSRPQLTPEKVKNQSRKIKETSSNKNTFGTKPTRQNSDKPLNVSPSVTPPDDNTSPEISADQQQKIQEIVNYVDEQTKEIIRLRSIAYQADENATNLGKKWIQAINNTLKISEKEDVVNPDQHQRDIEIAQAVLEAKGKDSEEAYNNAKQAWSRVSLQDRIVKEIDKSSNQGISLEAIKQRVADIIKSKPLPRVFSNNPTPKRMALEAGAKAAKEARDGNQSQTQIIAAATNAAIESAKKSGMVPKSVTNVGVEAALEVISGFSRIGGGSPNNIIKTTLEDLLEEQKHITKLIKTTETELTNILSEYNKFNISITASQQIYEKEVLKEIELVQKIENPEKRLPNESESNLRRNLAISQRRIKTYNDTRLKILDDFAMIKIKRKEIINKLKNLNKNSDMNKNKIQAVARNERFIRRSEEKGNISKWNRTKKPVKSSIRGPQTTQRPTLKIRRGNKYIGFTQESIEHNTLGLQKRVNTQKKNGQQKLVKNGRNVTRKSSLTANRQGFQQLIPGEIPKEVKNKKTIKGITPNEAHQRATASFDQPLDEQENARLNEIAQHKKSLKSLHFENWNKAAAAAAAKP